MEGHLCPARNGRTGEMSQPWKKEMKTRTTSSSLIALLLACFALPQSTQALLPPPPPDGGYPGANTAEGDGALFNLTDGIGNTAVGFEALNDNTTGDDNTANGFQALAGNTPAPGTRPPVFTRSLATPAAH